MKKNLIALSLLVMCLSVGFCLQGYEPEALKVEYEKLRSDNETQQFYKESMKSFDKIDENTRLQAMLVKKSQEDWSGSRFPEQLSEALQTFDKAFRAEKRELEEKIEMMGPYCYERLGGWSKRCWSKAYLKHRFGG